MPFAQVETLSSMPWYAWVAIVGIAGSMLMGALHAILNHRERLAMIQQGMHPDAPRDPAKVEHPEL
jgi:hypothetical protein